MNDSFSIVIPCRLGSTRLPGKPLLDIHGKPMVQRVYERALETGVSNIIIATDDESIEKACLGFGAQVCMTSESHPSGTDRLQEVAEKMGFADDDVIVNLQGDEPLMPSAVVHQVANNLIDNPDFLMATLCEPISDAQEVNNPNSVKVVTSHAKRALYFSRASIPFGRDDRLQPQVFRHLGIYAYRCEFLHQYVQWPETHIEQCEKLEQLRALYFDTPIHVDVACESIPPGVDTQQDLERVRHYFEQSSN